MKMPEISQLLIKSRSWFKLRHSRRSTSAPTCNSLLSTRAMDLERRLMESSVLPLKRVSSTEKKIMYGPFLITESSQSQFSLSAWHQASRTTSHTHFSVVITHLKSWEENKAYKPSKTTQETTSQASGLGPWTQKISFTMANLFSTVNKQRHTQLLSILEALSQPCLQSSITFSKTNGGKISQTLIANLMLHSVRAGKVAQRWPSL